MNAQRDRRRRGRHYQSILRGARSGRGPRENVQSCNRQKSTAKEERGNKSSFPTMVNSTDRPPTDRPTYSEPDLRRWRRFRYFWLILLLLRNSNQRRGETARTEPAPPPGRVVDRSPTPAAAAAGTVDSKNRWRLDYRKEIRQQRWKWRRVPISKLRAQRRNILACLSLVRRQLKSCSRSRNYWCENSRYPLLCST